MIAPNSGTDFTQAYETLRAEVTGGSTTPGLGVPRGLALLLRGGLAGWMQGWRHPVPHQPTPAPPGCSPCLPPLSGAVPELTLVLAQMALAAAAGDRHA